MAKAGQRRWWKVWPFILKIQSVNWRIFVNTRWWAGFCFVSGIPGLDGEMLIRVISKVLKWVRKRMVGRERACPYWGELLFPGFLFPLPLMKYINYLRLEEMAISGMFYWIQQVDVLGFFYVFGFWKAESGERNIKSVGKNVGEPWRSKAGMTIWLTTCNQLSFYKEEPSLGM